MKPVPSIALQILITYPPDADGKVANNRIDYALSENSLRRVLAHFNPTDNEWVTLIKLAHAFAMDTTKDAPVAMVAATAPGDPPGSHRAEPNGFAARQKAIALTHLETAQMHAVKALFAEA